jgi:hypothetical protein
VPTRLRNVHHVFQYREVTCGILSSVSGRLSLPSGMFIACLFFLGAVLVSSEPWRRPRKPGPARAISLLPPRTVRQQDPPRQSSGSVRIARIARVFPHDKEKAPDPESRVRYQFDNDRVEQYFARILERYKCCVGFVDHDIVKYRFEAPDWQGVEIPAEGISLRSFYYFYLDESTGRYPFLENLRHRFRELESMKPYALLGFAVQDEIEKLIRTAAAGKCGSTEDLHALLKIEADATFRVVTVECISKQPGAHYE